MNWNRAKTYLILALLLVNILLGYSIYMEIQANKPRNTYSEEMIRHFHNYLKQHEISLDTTLVEEKDMISPIEVNYLNISETLYPHLFYDFRPYIRVQKGKKLTMAIPLAMIMTEDTDHLEYTEKFIKRYFPDEDMTLKYNSRDEHGEFYYYTPLYKGRPLEEAFLTFQFDDTFHALNITKINIQPRKSSVEEHSVSSPIKAVSQVVSQMAPGSHITQVELVYYYRPENDSDLLLTERARAFPSWRIQTSDHQFFYVSAIHQ